MRVKFATLLVMSFCCVLAFMGCGKTGVQEQPLTSQEREAEKQAILRTLEIYSEAATERNWAKMVTTLADEVTFFGTDSGEVTKNFNEFKSTIQKQWEKYEVIGYGKAQDVFIQLDDYARFASVVFGAPIYLGATSEKVDTIFALYQRTLKKDPRRKDWVITSGILTIPRPAPDSR